MSCSHCFEHVGDKVTERNWLDLQSTEVNISDGIMSIASAFYTIVWTTLPTN